MQFPLSRPSPTSICRDSNGRNLCAATSNTLRYNTSLRVRTILLPFAIDPLGRWGPITTTFLQGNKSSIQYTFQKTRNNAALMFQQATSTPCPLGILRTADANWKQNKNRNFFGFSHTAPTPAIHTMQQLGLGITKAFSIHIRNASKEFDSTADTAETNFPTTIDN